MARGDEEWVGDIISAVADIRDDTAAMDFSAFAAKPAIVRSVLYSIAVIGEAAKNISPGFKAAHPDIPWGASATGSCTNIFAPILAASGTSSPMTSTRWRLDCESRCTALHPRRDPVLLASPATLSPATMFPGQPRSRHSIRQAQRPADPRRCGALNCWSERFPERVGFTPQSAATPCRSTAGTTSR
jgi:hypothetical protein